MNSYRYKYHKYKTKYINLKGGAKYKKSVSEPWYSLIKSGKKSVEGRLKKGDFADMKIGDIVTWTNDNNKSFDTKIIIINQYDTFEDYLTKEGLENTLPIDEVKSIKDGVNIYRKYYTIEHEQEYGILAIHLEVIEDDDIKGGELSPATYKYPYVRLGLCCSIVNLKFRHSVYSSRRSILKTIYDKGLEYAQSVAKSNVADLLRMVIWSNDHGIKVMRISSELVPHGNNVLLIDKFGQKGKDYISLEFLRPYLEAVGKIANSENIRITFHPGQFVQMASPDKKAFENSIRELVMHTQFLDMMGMDQNSVIVFHIGGTYCDKPNTVKRFIDNFKKLPSKVRARVVLENDEKCYDAEDVLEICEAVNAPMVFDYFHYICYKKYHKDATQASIDSMMPRILKTWTKKNIRPKFHLSEQMEGKQVGSHSVFIKNIPDKLLEVPSKYNIDVDIMIEAKGKEIALSKLYKLYPSLKPPTMRELPKSLPKGAIKEMNIPPEIRDELICECEE